MYTFLFGHLCTCTAGKPCTCPPVHVPDCTPVYLPTCEPLHLSACVPAYLTTCISAYLLTCALPFLSICAPIHLHSSSPTYHCTPAYLQLHRYLPAHSPIPLRAYTFAPLSHLHLLTCTPSLVLFGSFDLGPVARSTGFIPAESCTAVLLLSFYSVHWPHPIASYSMPSYS